MQSTVTQLFQHTGSSAPAAQTADLPGPKYDYDAFVSYRRRDSTRLAHWIRSRLQRYRLPPEILEELSPDKQALHSRRPRIWLDTSYEKSSDDFLLKKVFPALDASARLIVVSTPAALENIAGKDGTARDNWLVREIDHFLGANGVEEGLRAIDVVFGPGAIEGRYPGRLSERSRWDWIDLRSFSRWYVDIFSGKLDRGLSKLVASLYEIPDRFLPILQREERLRRHRTLMAFAGVSLLVTAVTAGSLIWALKERAGRLCEEARSSSGAFHRNSLQYHEINQFGLGEEWQRQSDELSNDIQKYCPD